jgi:hypothetical protein
MTLEAKMSRDGLKYHCVVTDKYGQTQTSNDITLYVRDLIENGGFGSPEVTIEDVNICADCVEVTETVEAVDAEATAEVVEAEEVIEITENIEEASNVDISN